MVEYPYMVNIKQQFKFVAIVLFAAVVLCVAWSTQKIGSFIKKTALHSESIRIAQTNTCAPTEAGAETPHFSGCNSLL